LGVDPVTGKRRTRYRIEKGTRQDAERRLRQLQHEVDEGEYATSAGVTVKKFLARWLRHSKSRVSLKTFERYEQLAEINIVPVLGEHRLDQLRPFQIDGAWDQLLKSGRKDGKGGLSPQTVKHCHRLLKQALAQAVKWQIISRNPADAIEPPRVTRQAQVVLDAGQTVTLIEALRDTQFHIPALIAVTTGLRRGEVLALRWKHLDVDSGMLTVMESLEQTKMGLRFKEPKSSKLRQVAMPVFLADVIRTHRIEQAEALLKLGIRQTGETLVCCRYDGEPMSPENLSRQFPIAVEKAGLPRITFHGLRHSHATQMLVAGVHMKVASERLGHSGIGITMDLYSHVLPGAQEEAVAKVDRALQAAVNSRSQST